jgi:16S rRNA C967 or C1407 C5-methylase (RsmB/RsmF family)
VYSTSSILVEENEMLIERFLKWHPEFIFTKIDSKMGAAGLRGQKEALRFFPHIHNIDGAYIAKLVKKEE